MYPPERGRRYLIGPSPGNERAMIETMVKYMMGDESDLPEFRVTVYSMTGRIPLELILIMDSVPEQYNGSYQDSGMTVPSVWYEFTAHTPDGIPAKVSVATSGRPPESNWVRIG